MANIGKNVIENLTTAMYENAYTVYREYIQNSADSIDKAIGEGLILPDDAIVDINIEPGNRRITINDNAKGIPSNKFVKILTDIADSEKDLTKNKGFRGIGRLAGLGYCDKLIFKSSVVGESVESVIEWDGKQLREVLADVTQHPSASDFVDQITYVYQNKVDKNVHYFEVIMDNVIPESDDLLDKVEVIKYLEAVAPIPFANKFIFKSKIEDFCKEKEYKIDAYNIQVCGNQIFKNYGTKIYDGTVDKKTVVDQIIDVQFREFKSKEGKKLAWMWFGISNFEKQIKSLNEMRGIRLRKENIQIGDENTLGASPKFFKESRGNFYYIGEVYAVDSGLIPNARRDYFKINSTLKEFELQLRGVLYDELYKLYHYANQVKNAYKDQNEFKRKTEEYEKKSSGAGFVNEKDKEKAEKELEIAKEKAEKSKKVIKNREQDAKSNDTLNRVFSGISEAYKSGDNTINTSMTFKPEEKTIPDEKKFLSQNLSKYGRKERALVTKIYTIIQGILPRDMADIVISKIQEELSK